MSFFQAASPPTHVEEITLDGTNRPFVRMASICTPQEFAGGWIRILPPTGQIAAIGVANSRSVDDSGVASYDVDVALTFDELTLDPAYYEYIYVRTGTSLPVPAQITVHFNNLNQLREVNE